MKRNKPKYPEIFFESRGGELKAVMFDHIKKESDHQKLIFRSGFAVEIKVKKGQVTHQILFPTSKAHQFKATKKPYPAKIVE